MKSKEWCRILSQEKIAADIYSMWLETPSIAPEARARTVRLPVLRR